MQLKSVSNYWLSIIKQSNLRIDALSFNQQIKLKFEDGSKIKFNYATYVEDDDCYFIMTEHCGYFEVRKLGCKIKSKKMFGGN